MAIIAPAQYFFSCVSNHGPHKSIFFILVGPQSKCNLQSICTKCLSLSCYPFSESTSKLKGQESSPYDSTKRISITDPSISICPLPLLPSHLPQLTDTKCHKNHPPKTPTGHAHRKGQKINLLPVYSSSKIERTEEKM